jgi:aspartyl-tRNA synthetase
MHLYLRPGERLLDFFNDPKESFIPVTQAEICAPEGLKGTVAKSLKTEEVAEIARITQAKEGDLACIVADKAVTASKTLGALRLEFRDRLSLAPPDLLAFAWIVDFPMFEWSEEEEKWEPAHHIFTMPKKEHLLKTLHGPQCKGSK